MGGGGSSAGASGGGGRMRSGSLFSANSIWNDDNVSIHSNFLDNSGPNSNVVHHRSSFSNTNTPTPNSTSFISPTLGAQPSNLNLNNTPFNDNDNDTLDNLNANFNINRNRSYTTNAAIPIATPNHNHGAFAGHNNPLSTSPFQPGAPNPPTSANGSTSSHLNGGSGNDINSLLDNLMNNMNSTPRNRAQTFSGIAPPAIQEDFPSSYSRQLQQPQPHQAQLQAQAQAAQVQAAQAQAAQAAQAQAMAQSQFQSQQSINPLLVDDFDLSTIVITNNFENPSLGPTPYLLFDNLPMFFNSVKLWSFLNNSFGNNNNYVKALNNILSIRSTTTSTSKLALVECASIEIAMNLKASFSHFEIVPGIILYIAFAKCNGTGTAKPPAASSSQPAPSYTKRSPNHEPVSDNVMVVDNTKIASTDLVEIKDDLLLLIKQLTSSKSHGVDVNKVVSMINKSLAYSNDNYQDNFGPLPDPIPIRQFDAPKLRELRKVLEYNEQLQSHDHEIPGDLSDGDPDNKYMSQLELDELCLAMLDELPELCYDYLGNTIVQKIFAVVQSPLIKLMMVKEITPYLTQLSIHKNGTWAIQKIINLCKKDYQQKYLIGASLKPYAVKLFNDQFGNYVLQGCIKFGSPFNDFIFEAMLDNFIEISFGRFGARSIRTILETSNERYISKEQIILVSGLIVEYANELVVNNNGSLLITWFLDTFNGFGTKFDKKYSLLTDKFLDNLQALCTHRLANLTILKILNNRQDLDLKQLIMNRIFGEFDESNDESIKPPSKLLEGILTENGENNAGPLFIYKILSNPLLLNLSNSPGPLNGEGEENKNSKYQKFIIQQIRRLLLELNINNYQPYKKLMDEVGLSSTRINRSGSLSKRNKRGVGRYPGSGYNGHSQHSQGPNGPGHGPGSAQVPNGPGHGPNSQGHNGGHNAPGYNGPPMTPQQLSYLQSLSGQFNPYNQGYTGPGPAPNAMPMMNMPAYLPPMSSNGNSLPQNPQDFMVMQQLEQLSLSSAAMGYNSNPGTPGDMKKNLYM